jgi:competence protein ComEA
MASLASIEVNPQNIRRNVMHQSRISVVALLVALAWLAPSPGEGAPAKNPDVVDAATTEGDAVNINTADIKQLMKLEGVGRRVAEKIVEYREHHGRFQKPDELRKVEGIGSGLWERNRARIVVK